MVTIDGVGALEGQIKRPPSTQLCMKGYKLWRPSNVLVKACLSRRGYAGEVTAGLR